MTCPLLWLPWVFIPATQDVNVWRHKFERSTASPILSYGKNSHTSDIYSSLFLSRFGVTLTINTVVLFLELSLADQQNRPNVSELLTVWMRLHVEFDSIGLVAGNQVLGTILEQGFL